jgi:hypothetical protein
MKGCGSNYYVIFLIYHLKQLVILTVYFFVLLRRSKFYILNECKSS